MRKVLPRWAGAIVLFPSTELLVCPGCGGVARDESVLDRVMSALFLLPFLLVIVGAIGTGVYLLGAMLLDWNPSGAYTIIALVLLAAGGYAGWRAAGAFRRLLSPRRMLPLAGWGTDL
ncbi:MAG TPA: hypothetical protein VEM76_03530 [Anaeromyxobacteraceae bacterium]|nr:hypothetical protein [Anaeromyxobacteraceae bacterium]